MIQEKLYPTFTAQDEPEVPEEEVPEEEEIDTDAEV